MDAQFRKHLNDAAMEVFGTMYFTPIELLDELPSSESSGAGGPFVRASITFEGIGNAAFEFYFPIELARFITEGFLGIEPAEVQDAQITDTMKEAANIIIGNLLGKIDPEGKGKLGIPTAVLGTFSRDAMDENSELLALLSDFGTVWLTVAMKEA